MSPERIAELRAVPRPSFTNDMRKELLDEIERLRSMILRPHALKPGYDDECACGFYLADAGCPTCDHECWVWEDEKQECTKPCQCVVDAMAAHVADVLEGRA